MVTCAYKTFTALGRYRMWDEFFMKFYATVFVFQVYNENIERQNEWYGCDQLFINIAGKLFLVKESNVIVSFLFWLTIIFVVDTNVIGAHFV